MTMIRKHSYFILLICLMVFLSGCSGDDGGTTTEAPPGAWGTAEQIDAVTGATAYDADIDVGSNAVAVWSQYDGVSDNIWARSYVEGSGWGTAQIIDEDPGDAWYVEVAVQHGVGNAFAVWTQDDGIRDNIWSNRYTPGGGWGTAELIETDNAGDTERPQVAVDVNGNAIAVWYQSDGSVWNIWSNRYTLGSGWGTAELIETDNTGSAWNPEIAVDANGNATAVWHQYDGTRNNIWSNRYTPGGGWGTAGLIETDNAGGASDPVVGVDVNGNAIAVWRQYDGTRNNIWSNRYTPGGGWGTAELIETDNAGSADGPQVAVDVNGNAIAVWYQYDTIRNNIWSNRYTPGSGWGTARLLETDDTSDAQDARVAMNSSGNAIATWYQGVGAGDKIWARRYVPGTGWLSSEEIHSTLNVWNQRVAIDSAGTVYVVWTEEDTVVQASIWAKLYHRVFY